MDEDGDAVGGQRHVALDAVGAQADRASKRRNRILLAPPVGSAAMDESDRKVGPRRGHLATLRPGLWLIGCTVRDRLRATAAVRGGSAA
jgi:hypothetical protein